MNKEAIGIWSDRTIRLLGPWRRFARLRASGRSTLACAWQAQPARCCDQTA
jgi:hypothetical protein